VLYPLSYGDEDFRPGGEIGGAEGDRTLDLRIANATLSQLSYRPTTRAAILAITIGDVQWSFETSRCGSSIRRSFKCGDDFVIAQ
jgi:hypothetical protein